MSDEKEFSRIPKSELPPRPEDAVSVLAAVSTAVVSLEQILDQLSEIEGGIRTLGKGADIHSVRRIRTANNRIHVYAGRLAESFSTVFGWISARSKGMDTPDYSASRQLVERFHRKTRGRGRR